MWFVPWRRPYVARYSSPASFDVPYGASGLRSASSPAAEDVHVAVVVGALDRDAHVGLGGQMDARCGLDAFE